MLTARAGAWCTARLSEATLKRLCGAFQIIVAPLVPFRDRIVAFFKEQNNDEGGATVENETGEEPVWRRRLSLMGIGLGSGCVYFCVPSDLNARYGLEGKRFAHAW